MSNIPGPVSGVPGAQGDSVKLNPSQPGGAASDESQAHLQGSLGAEIRKSEAGAGCSG